VNKDADGARRQSMAVAPRILVQRQPGFQLGWMRQRADSAMPPPKEMSMQRANSLALEEQMDSQVKPQTPLWPASLSAQESLRGSRSAQAKSPG
jgi:hypothetical protein